MFNLNPTYYETPGGTSAPGVPAPPAQPAQPTPQAGAPAQGQGQGGFRQTFFPNVPDDQWGMIEPHISGVNQHVTQLEQRYAPLKSYTPEAVQGLASFAQAFDQDPLGQWISLAKLLQDSGIIDPDLDLEDLATIAPPGSARADEQPGSQGVGISGLQGVPPEIQQLIEQQNQQIAQLQQRLDQGDQTSRQRVEDAALKRQMTWMKEQLTKGGIPEDLITDQDLLARFIAHQGNAQAAVQEALNYRTKLLGGVVQNGQQQQKSKDLDTSGGVPKANKRTGSNRRGMFSDVTAAAQQALERANRE